MAPLCQHRALTPEYEEERKMAPQRLSALDASFLDVETASAHMHVGWAAAFDPPEDGPAPSFEQLRDHISRRLHRAPRYRQRLAEVPFGLSRPVWVDDEAFELCHHVRRAPTGDLRELAGTVLSTPLARDRPLWEMWIADELDDGRIGVVGKAHHCMVDGIAAVELAALLLDPEPEPPPDQPDGWTPRPAPGAATRLMDGVVDRAAAQLSLFGTAARLATSPSKLAGGVRSATRALLSSLAPANPVGALNERISPYRTLSTLGRPLEDLRAIKREHGCTLNDVVLAAACGGVRRYLERRDEEPGRLKAMVPVNVRAGGAEGELGNRISFIFLELPCDEPDPEARLSGIARATREAKRADEPAGATTVLDLAAAAPSPLQRAVSRLVASPRTFNVVVSNIPGPQEPLWMLGCRLREAFPVVPLADRHALSIGFTSIAGGAFFGVYADRDAVSDAERLAGDIGRELDGLAGGAAVRPREEAAPVA
jgi:diacylglycerol O-acyltransferase / wax synthase